MIQPFRHFWAPLALCFLVAAAPALAQKPAAQANPDRYLCPNATGGAVDCFLHAVEHLYTMCRQVKSIEIIEFGYERSTEGVNGAKSDSCIDKHRQTIVRPYRAALGEAKGASTAVVGLEGLHSLWVRSLAELKWKAGESDAEYKARVAQPYAVFAERATAVRAALPPVKAKAATAVTASARPKSAN